MLRGFGLSGRISIGVLFLVLGGCAVIPLSSSKSVEAEPVAERDQLASAVEAVQEAPWPKPQSVSLFARITGGGEDGLITKSDAIDAYIDQLSQSGSRADQLKVHVRQNLVKTERLQMIVDAAFVASRYSMNDVALIETAIQALREHRDIYSETAKTLRKAGEPISDDEIDALRDDYQLAIKALGRKADRLAEQIEHDRTRAFASPSARRGKIDG